MWSHASIIFSSLLLGSPTHPITLLCTCSHKYLTGIPPSHPVKALLSFFFFNGCIVASEVEIVSFIQPSPIVGRSLRLHVSTLQGHMLNSGQALLLWNGVRAPSTPHLTLPWLVWTASSQEPPCHSAHSALSSRILQPHFLQDVCCSSLPRWIRDTCVPPAP